MMTRDNLLRWVNTARAGESAGFAGGAGWSIRAYVPCGFWTAWTHCAGGLKGWPPMGPYGGGGLDCGRSAWGPRAGGEWSLSTTLSAKLLKWLVGAAGLEPATR